MTMAAGFRVANGILLCADQLHVAGDGATSYAPKLVAGETDNRPICTFGFAYAGNMANAQLAIRACLKAIDHSKHLGPDGVLEALQRSILSTNRAYVDRHKGPEVDIQRFELLIAIACEGEDRTEMFATSGAAINPVDKPYYFLGVGGAYGECVGRVMPTREATSLEVALLLANRALATAKRYTNDCGGPSSFTFISPTVRVPIVLETAEPFVEDYVTGYESTMDRILLQCVDEKGSEEAIIAECEKLKASARLMRIQWRVAMEGCAMALRKELPRLKLLDLESTMAYSSGQQPALESRKRSGES